MAGRLRVGVRCACENMGEGGCVYSGQLRGMWAHTPTPTPTHPAYIHHHAALCGCGQGVVGANAVRVAQLPAAKAALQHTRRGVHLHRGGALHTP